MIPLETTAPNPEMGSNLLAGLTGDILKKVTKSIVDTTSQHATEALQQGVPYGHILEQLIQMSPVNAGIKTGSKLMGGGSQPPGGGNPGGGGQPPQQPQGQKSQDSGVTPAVASTPSIDNSQMPGVQPQVAQPMPQDINAGMPPNPGVGQALLRALLGGNIGPNVAPSQTDILKRQVLYGQTPQGELNTSIAKAQLVPPTQYEKGQMQAAAASYQLENAKAQMTALNQEQERATSEFNAMANSRGWLAKGLTPQKMIDQYKAKLDDISTRMDTARENLINIASTHPNLKQPQINSKDLIGKTIGKYKLVSIK